MNWYENHVSEVADCWASNANRMACSGIFPRFYVYFAPSTETEYGSLMVLPEHEDAPQPFKVATPECLPHNATRDQIRAKLWDIGRRLPIIKWG